ncbi:acyl-CoA dehydrogenase family protein [Zavarzinia sp.]|uniref:acyl-CoA dehydrogenase family protein n=1 Tax=Zavarzinia sp. TaxID=2027920 RepID=UPI0035645C6F
MQNIDVNNGAGWRPVLAEVRAALAETAIKRDRAGGTAKVERDLFRRSGLLTLAVPAAFGGIGADWATVFEAVRLIAQVDSSLGHLFAFQHLQVASVLLYGSAEQQESLSRATVEQGWFWGNALNPRDPRTRLVPNGSGYRLDGTKSFCSGATDSDHLLVSALDPTDTLRIVALPTDRSGITVLDDWDNMGQRQTDSGTVSFEAVAVDGAEVLGPPGPGGSPRATLRACLAQAILGTLYLGIAEGALAAAVDFTREKSQPWPASGAATTVEDSYLQLRYGELQVDLAGAQALSTLAIAALQKAWDRGEAVTPTERGEAALAIATFKVAAARAGLDITSRLFEQTGARATAARYGLDRFWRNLRTHTLHDPLDYKLKEIGSFVLTGAVPTPGLYS